MENKNQLIGHLVVGHERDIFIFRQLISIEWRFFFCSHTAAEEIVIITQMEECMHSGWL